MNGRVDEEALSSGLLELAQRSTPPPLDLPDLRRRITRRRRRDAVAVVAGVTAGLAAVPFSMMLTGRASSRPDLPSASQGRPNTSRASEPSASPTADALPPIEAIPVAARDWGRVDAASCTDLDAPLASRTVVRLATIGVDCIAQAPLDGVVVFVGRVDSLPAGEPVARRATVGGHPADASRILTGMSAAEAAVARAPGFASVLIVRGAGSTGPTVLTLME